MISAYQTNQFSGVIIYAKCDWAKDYLQIASKKLTRRKKKGKERKNGVTFLIFVNTGEIKTLKTKKRKGSFFCYIICFLHPIFLVLRSPNCFTKDVQKKVDLVKLSNRNKKIALFLLNKIVSFFLINSN